MIEVTELRASRMLCIRFQGVQSAAQFGALSVVISQTATCRRWRVLFDWTGLEGWDDRHKFSLSCRDWQPTAARISRVSIVHGCRWNRQAALLAAVFRVHGIQVRSCCLRNREQALAWLQR
jgi:hypothetical protein